MGFDPRKIVVLSGSGVSAESGLPTFRDANGLWRQHSWMQLASLDGWRARPEVVLEFYNERRAQAWRAEPNAAHVAIARLQQHYHVVVITQNVDALHERAGSRHVVHLHGELAYARSSRNPSLRYRLDDKPIAMGQLCDEGSQLRPDIVWFGESVDRIDEARAEIADAGKVLVVGTSLAVYPAASLVDVAHPRAERVLVAFDVEQEPRGYEFLRGKATEHVPRLAARWLAAADEGAAQRA